MATLIERLMYETESDADVTEGIIPLDQFESALVLFDSGKVDAAFIKTAFNMTQAQGDELDEILATRPVLGGAPTPAEIVAAATWPIRTIAPLQAAYAVGGAGWAGYEHPADIRAALGLA